MFATEPTPIRRPRILVVEDSPVIRRLIEVCLRPLEVQVTMAPDGVSGLESAAVEIPDLVVLDIGLPGIDGWEVLGRLRSGPLTSHIPVMMLTGHGERYGITDAETRGAEAFMTKPFQPDALRRQVADLLPEEPSHIVGVAEQNMNHQVMSGVESVSQARQEIGPQGQSNGDLA